MKYRLASPISPITMPKFPITRPTSPVTRVGQNHVYTAFLTGKSPNVRSYVIYDTQTQFWPSLPIRFKACHILDVGQQRLRNAPIAFEAPQTLK